MPSVKMRTKSQGPAGTRIAGHTYQVSAEEGEALVRGGFASWVEAPPQEPAPERETASVRPAERAMVPRPQPKRRR